MTAVQKLTRTAAILHPDLGEPVRGELVERHDNGDVTIRYAGAFIMRGRELTIEEIIEWQSRKADG